MRCVSGFSGRCFSSVGRIQGRLQPILFRCRRGCRRLDGTAGGDLRGGSLDQIGGCRWWIFLLMVKVVEALDSHFLLVEVISLMTFIMDSMTFDVAREWSWKTLVRSLVARWSLSMFCFRSLSAGVILEGSFVVYEISLREIAHASHSPHQCLYSIYCLRYL